MLLHVDDGGPRRSLKPIHDWVMRYEDAWNERFDRLDAVLEDLATGGGGWKHGRNSGKATVALPTDTRILIRGELDAPRHLVFRACTEPELVKRWWSGIRGEVTGVEIDLRVGGSWRYVMVANEGFEVAFHGTYREIVLDERVVSTELYEGVPDAAEDDATLNTMTLTDLDGRTLLQTLVECPSREIRDAILDSGMEGGMQEAFDKLEEVAGSLA